MPIKNLEAGLIVFETEGKVIGKGDGLYSPITQWFRGEVPLDIAFQDGSEMSFRFGLDGQKFISRQKFFEGSGIKEVFLQPAHYNLKYQFSEKGYTPRKDGNELYDDYGKRVQESFAGLPLDYLALVQHPEIGVEQVILRNKNGELRVEYNYGFLIAIEEIPRNGIKTIYSIGRKGPWCRVPNFMVMAYLAQQQQADTLFEKIESIITKYPSFPLQPVTENDLFYKLKNKGRVVHLGSKIR